MQFTKEIAPKWGENCPIPARRKKRRLLSCLWLSWFLVAKYEHSDPETSWWGGGLRSERVRVQKLVPSLQIQGKQTTSLGHPGDFTGMPQTQTTLRKGIPLFLPSFHTLCLTICLLVQASAASRACRSKFIHVLGAACFSSCSHWMPTYFLPVLIQPQRPPFANLACWQIASHSSFLANCKISGKPSGSLMLHRRHVPRLSDIHLLLVNLVRFRRLLCAFLARCSIFS